MALPINIENLLNGNTIEWDRIELKKAWDPTDIVHDICAFANDVNNWDGGYIIIGVEETKGVAVLPPKGLERNQIDSYQKKLIEISKKVSPDYFPQSMPYKYDGKHIYIIWVFAGDNRPYKAPVSLSKKKSEKAYYIRKASTTVKVQPGSIEERRLIELSSRIPFDDRIYHSANLDDLKLSLIQSYLQEIKSSLFDESIKIPFSELTIQMKIAKGPT
jgi:ATP-dependent DNA helicase RecG